MYCIVDIETTGGNHSTGKITEIAIYKHDGFKVIDEYQSLVNPEIPIPPFITRLTGIDNQMVRTAPRFFEVAKEIVEITKDCTFVAHNVGFDYNFIKAEFAQLGYSWELPRVCTVKLSRKAFPGLPSYSLGKLCRQLEIPLNDRHRAAGDAQATTKLFERILRSNKLKLDQHLEEEINFKALHPDFDKGILDLIPKTTGVYYFYDEDTNLIYVGKSNNIRSRVMQHLRNTKSKKAFEMAKAIVRVDYKVTGSELLALLLESDEIKVRQPKFNRAQKRTRMNFGLYADYDDKGYIRLKVERLNKDEDPLTLFSSALTGKQKLYAWCEKYQLCQSKCNLYNHSGPCFQYHVKECSGACVEEESPEEYNLRVRKAVSFLNYNHDSFVIVDKGRTKDELGVVVVENGKYLGFGFVHRDEGISSAIHAKELIDYYQDNKDTKQIISGFLKRKKIQKLIPFKSQETY